MSLRVIEHRGVLAVRVGDLVSVISASRHDELRARGHVTQLEGDSVEIEWKAGRSWHPAADVDLVMTAITFADEDRDRPPNGYPTNPLQGYQR